MRELTLNDSVRANKKLGSFKVRCKRPQHCWPTTPNTAGCYMFRSFAHPLACCWNLLWSNFKLSVNGRNNSQHFWELLANNVASVCTGLKIQRHDDNKDVT